MAAHTDSGIPWHIPNTSSDDDQPFTSNSNVQRHEPNGDASQNVYSHNQADGRQTHEDIQFPGANSTLLTSSPYEQPQQSPQPQENPATASRWPTAPIELRTATAGTIFADVVAIIFSLPFLVLAVIIIRLDGTRVDERHQHYINAIFVAATSFPIVFASVVGRLTSQVARWKLERGSSVDSLEQWLGSRTVFSAIYTQIRLSSVNAAAAFIALMWVFSPLSTQSVQRALGMVLIIDEQDTEIQYFNTDVASNFSGWLAVSAGSAREASGAIALLDAFYVTLLLATDDNKAAPVDMWGYLKIPLLSSFRPNAASSSTDTGWSVVPFDGSASYSALAGLPLSSIPAENSTFSMESSYIDLSCYNISSTPGYNQTSIAKFGPNGNNTGLVNGTFTGSRVDYFQSGDETTTQSRAAATWWLAMDNFVDTIWEDGVFQSNRSGHWVFPSEYSSPAVFANETGIEASQATLLLGTTDKTERQTFASPTSETLAYCKVLQPYVESRVECISSSSSSFSDAAASRSRPSCKVVAQRPSQKPHAPSIITHLSFPNVFRGIAGNLPWATRVTAELSRADLSIYYLKNTSTKYMTQQTVAVPLTDIPSTIFSQRLSQLLNTYLLLSQTYDDITGRQALQYAHSTATNQQFAMVYAVTRGWAVVFLTGSLVLLACSVAGVVFAHLAVTPDILGSASAAVRDSCYVQLPYGAGALDGLQLAKALKGHPVQYGVIMGGQALGVSWKGFVARARRGGRYW
ncbi:hypothetical protein B0H63DRAFT_510472 [Podospora didyma]|uniref:Uncharacterized protein n=1 Tax=Podospora didyma TaxID=330526 RepID=A0AAE0U061_9PEZI|nr:hypothetical protein B0H63DRAFT_510472 [Podospora didyma]